MTANEKPPVPGTSLREDRPLAGPRIQGPSRDDGPPDDPPELRATVARARQGDQDAFRELLETFQDRVFRLAIRVLHCDRGIAEDLVQEVFMRVYKGLPNFGMEVPVWSWMRTIAMNTAITEYRKAKAMKRNRTTLSLDATRPDGDKWPDPPGHERDPSEQVDHKDFSARVRAAVRDLPDDFRDAVILRDMEGMSYEEIGEALGVPAGTVRSRIHRGRLLLQASLGGFNG